MADAVPSQRRGCFDWAIVTLLAPFWIPLQVVDAVSARRRRRTYLQGSSVESWARLRELWARADAVHGGEQGPRLEVPVEHEMVVAFAQRYPEAVGLAEAGLLDPNAYVVAYAFRVLVRLKKVALADMPAALLAREEKIRSLLAGSIASEMPLGAFVKGYFPPERAP